MGMQLSVEEANRRDSSSGETGARGQGTARVRAHIAAIIHQLSESARHALERIKHAQARGGKRKQMRLIESLALGNRRQILLVACDNQRYLVGVGPDSVGSILAMDTAVGSRERSARGPELVRRRGREANLEARTKTTAEAGLELWQ